MRIAYESMADLGFLTDRDADLWMPLFAVCACVSPERVAAPEKIVPDGADGRRKAVLMTWRIRCNSGCWRIYARYGLLELRTCPLHLC